MDLTTIPLDTWVGQGIFCVLFVWMLMTTMKESRQREDKLLNQIEKQNAAQEKIVSSLERLELQIQDIKNGGN
ncbi:BhlA holin family protein [Terribacillus halophilus]|uniref:BhlA holin family protein n=1 Tax=Terribacillus halophilus TaxID=361279 RepID=A0A1G6PLF5_9BACI|nr:BhlA/UviB family holin-like peptide [Terribacillus halophilus]SDC80356.1 BhlA holin family protein [Terribacillus halophilus]